MTVKVKVRCIYCSKTRDIGPGDVRPGDVPMCDCSGGYGGGQRHGAEVGAMKLFIWNEPFDGSYQGGVIFALAPDEKAARKLVLAERRGNGSLGLRGGRLGSPDTVVDGPYAQSYEWSE